MILWLLSKVTEERARISWPKNAGVSTNSMAALRVSPTMRSGQEIASAGLLVNVENSLLISCQLVKATPRQASI